MINVNTITRVELKDFLVFKGEFTADFCPGVNVLIGGNGTGKTTLMKVMYRLCHERNEKLNEYFFSIGNTTGFNGNEFELAKVIFDEGNNRAVIHSSKMINNPISGELFRDGKWISIKFGEYKEKDFSLMFLPNENGQDELYLASRPIRSNAVYIPTAEMLSHAKGILEMLAKYKEVPFDKTQIDILVNAGLLELKDIPEVCKKPTEDISDIIDGEVEYDDGVFYIVKKSGKRVAFSTEASGFRKFGLLWKLLCNGLLETGSILFWDEPENSLNPELIPTLVGILLELSRNGVQVFIATHNYDVARWFELDKIEGDSLRYFNLTNTGNGIEEVHADSYVSLPTSVIDNADSKMLRRVAEVAAENAGVKLK
jgi:energy-coupling factor transporter ATP-binding protein EcfA2